MSPTALRWTALPLGLLAAGLRIAGDLWLHARIRELSVALYLLSMLALFAVAMGIPLAIFVLLSRGPRPARLVTRDGRLTVPQSPAYAGNQAILMMFLGAGLIEVDRWLRTAPVAGLFFAGALAFLLVQRPWLALDAEGLTVKRLWRMTRLRWDELSLEDMALDPGRHPGRFWIAPGVSIPVGWLHVDPGFLTHVIRHYVERPEERATIPAGGTPLLYAPRRS